MFPSKPSQVVLLPKPNQAVLMPKLNQTATVGDNKGYMTKVNLLLCLKLKMQTC